MERMKRLLPTSGAILADNTAFSMNNGMGNLRPGTRGSVLFLFQNPLTDLFRVYPLEVEEPIFLNHEIEGAKVIAEYDFQKPLLAGLYLQRSRTRPPSPPDPALLPIHDMPRLLWAHPQAGEAASCRGGSVPATPPNR